MMLHEWYRERRDERRREMEANLRAAEAARVAAEAARVTAEEAKLASEEANAQLRQHLAAWNAWNQRRLRALASGEPFDEPPPNGTERH